MYMLAARHQERSSSKGCDMTLKYSKPQSFSEPHPLDNITSTTEENSCFHFFFTTTSVTCISHQSWL